MMKLISLFDEYYYYTTMESDEYLMNILDEYETLLLMNITLFNNMNNMITLFR